MTRTRRQAAAAACAAALLALGASPAGAAPAPSTTERASHGASTGQFPRGGEVISVSDDGCLALVAEWGDAVAPGDDNAAMDGFIRDCETGSIEHVTVDPDGDVLVAGVMSVSMSADARYVVYVAPAADWASSGRLYVRDRVTGTTRLAPVPPWAAGGEWAYDRAAIDPDGRYVAATIYGSLYLLDLQQETAALVGGAWGAEFAHLTPPVSTDGDIVFASSYGIVSEDTDQTIDAYLYDRSSGTVSLLAKRASGEIADTAWYPAISANGRYVAFAATFSDGSGAWVVDRQEGSLLRVDRLHDGSPSDGVVGVGGTTVSDTCDVAYETFSPGIIPVDTNPGQNGSDVYVWDCAANETIVASVTDGGVQGTGFSSNPVITRNGRHVAFQSEAADLVSGDTNGAWDGFVRHLAADGG